MTELRVEVTDDFLATLVRDPVTGLIKLIDNALDAEANTIDVGIQRDELGKLSTVVVSDDGTGMTLEEAGNMFRPLGKSWKKQDRVGRRGRPRRGRRGRGRFAAFAIGDRVVWATTTVASAPDGGKASSTVRITGRADDLERFQLDGPFHDGATQGTKVTITGLSKDSLKLKSQATRMKLEEAYAVFLARQTSLTVTVDGLPLNAEHVQSQSYTRSVSIEDDVADAPENIRIVEWSAKV